MHTESEIFVETEISQYARELWMFLTIVTRTVFSSLFRDCLLSFVFQFPMKFQNCHVWNCFFNAYRNYCSMIICNIRSYEQLVACDPNETRNFTWFVDNTSKWVNYARALEKTGREERENAESAAGRCKGQNESFRFSMYAAEQPAPERPESKEGKAWIVEEKRGHKRRQRGRAIECKDAEPWDLSLNGPIGWVGLVPSASSLWERIDHQIRKRNIREWRVYLRMYGCTGREWTRCLLCWSQDSYFVAHWNPEGRDNAKTVALCYQSPVCFAFWYPNLFFRSNDRDRVNDVSEDR